MRLLYPGLLFSLWTLSSAQAHADTPDLTKISIHLVGTQDQLSQLGANDHWPQACKALGKSLRPKYGPWGLGAFRAFDCKAGNETAQLGPNWNLVVIPDKTKVRLEVTLSGISKPLATTEFRATDLSLTQLKNPELTTLLAADLLEQLPMLSAVVPSIYKPNLPAIVVKVNKGDKYLPAPPTELSIYSLELDAETHFWFAHVVAIATRKPEAEKNQIVWYLDRKLPKDQGQLWIHDVGGRSVHHKELSKQIDTVVEELWTKATSPSVPDRLTGQFSSAFVGTRYAHSISTGQLVNRVSLVSVLAELRGLPIDGLRFYYDIWPSVRETAALGAVRFSGNRLVAGWSFSHAVGGIFDRIDLVPKVGRWTMDIAFNLADQNGEVRNTEFKTVGALNFGLEAGIEKKINRLMLRLWASDDFGTNPLIKGSVTKVNNLRAGVDTLVKGPSLKIRGKDINLSFLLYGLYENMSLTKTGSTATEDIEVNGVRLQIALIGGGLAIAW